MSEKILSLSLRPQNLSGLFGQENTIAAIRKHMAKRPPQTWMLTGGSGCGKTTLARIIALGYQCTHYKLWGDACDNCKNAFERGQFAIHEINASAEAGGKEQLGEVTQLAQFKPVGSRYRVFILDEFHNATKHAQNLLLKPIEEPPPFTVWVVATTDPSKILPTMRRRFTTYNLKPLGLESTEKFLVQSAKAASISLPLRPLVAELENLGVSSPGLILQALEKYGAGCTAAESVSGADGSTIDTLRICKAVTSGDWRGLQTQLKTTTPEQSRYIRASVSGWLKGCLMRESGARAERFAKCLIDINAIAPLEDANLHPWLLGVLFTLCRRFEVTR
jgi:DNA polymerase-3 subunit gamma/tau